jgi:hypothetical protein
MQTAILILNSSWMKCLWRSMLSQAELQVAELRSRLKYWPFWQKFWPSQEFDYSHYKRGTCSFDSPLLIVVQLHVACSCVDIDLLLRAYSQIDNLVMNRPIHMLQLSRKLIILRFEWVTFVEPQKVQASLRWLIKRTAVVSLMGLQ